jgi:flagellar biogenesis protein FliO
MRNIAVPQVLRLPVLLFVASSGYALLGFDIALAEGSTSAALPMAGSLSEPYTPTIMASSARMIGGLFLCLGVFALGMRLVKRHSSRTSTGRRRIEVRERVALSPKASLTLISIDNKEFLVASGSDSVSILPTRSIPPGLFDESLDRAGDEMEAFNA